MIRVQGLYIQAGAFHLDDITFEAASGEYVALMGRTGSGKTTILECICGLRRPDAGRIYLGGVDVTDCRPGARGIGYLPQDLALFPSMTVEAQMAFPLRIRGVGDDAVMARILQLADALQIAHLLPRVPLGLSGGEAQRVALGRALAASPSILCLDEPLNALDRRTHDVMCDLLKEINRNGITILHVTHDITEADRLADRVLMIEGGRLVPVAQAQR